MTTENGFVRDASGFLQEAGYTPENLVGNYRFTWLPERNRLENDTADLVAFSHRVHSLQTACVAVVDGVARPAGLTLQKLRYLGAPAALVYTGQDVQLWPVKKELPSSPFRHAPQATWRQELRTQLLDLSPPRIVAAKEGNVRIPFVDVGLHLWVQDVTGQTLISLLESLLASSLKALPTESRTDNSAKQGILSIVFRLFAGRVLEDKGVIPEAGGASQLLAAMNDRFPDTAAIGQSFRSPLMASIAEEAYTFLRNPTFRE